MGFSPTRPLSRAPSPEGTVLSTIGRIFVSIHVLHFLVAARGTSDCGVAVFNEVTAAYTIGRLKFAISSAQGTGEPV
jgi:hypothetical protein